MIYKHKQILQDAISDAVAKIRVSTEDEDVDGFMVDNTVSKMTDAAIVVWDATIESSIYTQTQLGESKKR